MMHPLDYATYPARVQVLLAESGRNAWLGRELAKLDPTAYCLHLPRRTYQRLRATLPPLPDVRPQPVSELAYLAAFVSNLAGEDFDVHAAELATLADPTGQEQQRWTRLLRQLEVITRMLRVTNWQLRPGGRLLNRMLHATH